MPTITCEMPMSAMLRIFGASALALAVLRGAGAASAEPRCVTHNEISKQLERRYSSKLKAPTGAPDQPAPAAAREAPPWPTESSRRSTGPTGREAAPRTWRRALRSRCLQGRRQYL